LHRRIFGEKLGNFGEILANISKFGGKMWQKSAIWAKTNSVMKKMTK
jgi:hypothetical protein